MNCEEKKQNHNFFAYTLPAENPGLAQVVIFCTSCGEVRPLAYPAKK
jgi:hypothetical protein